MIEAGDAVNLITRRNILTRDSFATFNDVPTTANEGIHPVLLRLALSSFDYRLGLCRNCDNFHSDGGDGDISSHALSNICISESSEMSCFSILLMSSVMNNKWCCVFNQCRSGKYRWTVWYHSISISTVSNRPSPLYFHPGRWWWGAFNAPVSNVRALWPPPHAVEKRR